MSDWLTWIETHPGLASWFQAIGTLIAVGVAIWVPWRQHQLQISHQQEKEELQGCAVANSIYLHFLGLRAKAEGAKANLQAHYLDHLDERQFDQLERLKINPPPELISQRELYWLLGVEAAVPLLQAISIAENYDSLVDSICNDLNANMRSVEDAKEMKMQLERYPQSILDLIGEIDAGLAPLVDGATTNGVDG